MENASKALLIAGGLLIAMLIISIGVYLFLTYGDIGKSYEEVLTTNEKIKINSNFTKFEGREDITAQEIVTLYKFIKSYNEKNEPIPFNIILPPGVTPLLNSTSTEKDFVVFIEKNSNDPTNSNNIIYFKCDYNTGLKYNEDTGLVKELKFEL